MANDDSRLIYSTETGRICPTCGRPQKKCACKDKRASKGAAPESDGILRIRRETKGRGGKTVTTISGFDERDEDIKQLATRLKNLCGSGGSSKNGVIMIQGDHREAVRAELERSGFKVKIAGG
ncbi:translation initiation factor Sui1 [Desulfatitalea alkaliphila]|uniref:Translation initiation factor Sui1 n=1 Tax=Desulfatitalea alkaliphila TaxID=2929485 RepID=A0AA41R131_9BACT|nr:translation initiation factor Sui1 [Desulfatitalea alkaliphila]MCJ8500389.1 translation initiation factor Sui1 [Desulfatitalea alkaliphila]